MPTTRTAVYDAAGNRTSVEDSRGGVTTVTFDALDRQAAEELGGAGITRTRVSAAYNVAGEVTTVTRDTWGGGTRSSRAWRGWHFA